MPIQSLAIDLPMSDPKYQHGEPPAAEQASGDVIVSPDARRRERIPPGQTRTRKWPVLDAHGTPPLPPLDQWQLRVFGEVDTARQWSWAEFQSLPRVKVFADFHCVTTWSRLGNLWEGVSTRQLLSSCGVRPAAKFAVLHAYDHGWTTNLPLADFLADDALLADTHDGQPLDAAHGGPLRAIVPQLYAWKSAKWICGIELTAADRPGYWERLGYHNHGDPWTEERFG
jgi:DMSO/TMAO reductase YedYZ molybdopterin-dependent catalytic subunit